MGKIEINNFNILKRMAETSGDKIQSCGNENIKSVSIYPDHAEILIGIPPEIGVSMRDEKMRICLFVIDNEEFDKIKNDLEQ